MATRFKAGDIALIDKLPFRVIYVTPERVVLCKMKTEKLILVEWELKRFLDLFENERIRIEEDTDTSVVVIEGLSENGRKSYFGKSAAIKEINKTYGPDYMGLVETRNKKAFEEILAASGMKRNTFWRMVRRYLQSGMKESSLIRKTRVDEEAFRYNKKTGHPGAYGIPTGCIITDEIRGIFDIGLNYYKSGRAKSYQKAFDKINYEYFSTEKISNGSYEKVLLPMDKRPTYRQFTYYCRQRISASEMDEIKTSRREQRNDKRLLLGEDASNIEFPGEKVECDAVEFDLSLVSSIDQGQTIGRPIVYAMRDVLTHTVVAVSVALDNNSFIGLTNLMLNLSDPKERYCEKAGITLPDPRLWPSGFIPLELYADRGSDFKSDPFGRVCNELGIRRHLVTGGMGSMKGMIESWFHQMHSMINAHTEDAGLIEKRYDSKHHKEAVLTIGEFTKLVIICVLSYNQSHMDDYMPRLEEIQDGIDATPALLWEYYCGKKGAPKPITDVSSYLLKLMPKKQATLNRKGITFNQLTYINYNDADLLNRMYELQNKREHFDVRYDPRDDSRVYYMDSKGKIASAELNETVAWMKDLKGLTFKEVDDYLKAKKKRDLEARQRNEQIGASRFGFVESVMDRAKTERPLKPDMKNMREAREEEKQRVSRENTITARIDDVVPALEVEDKSEPMKELPDTSGKQKFLTDEEYLDLVAHYDEYEYEDE